MIDKIAVTGVDSAPAGTSVTVTATAQDVFGNKISGKTLNAIANGATLDTVTVTTGATLTNFGSADVKFVAPATGPVTIVFYAAAADMAAAVKSSLDAVAKDIAATVEHVDKFGKRVDAVEADTAFRKSGDLGEIIQDEPEMVQKSLWGGRFLTNADLFN